MNVLRHLSSKKKVKSYTLMIIPEKSGSAKSVHISKWLITIFSAFVFLFVAAVGIITLNFINLKKLHFNSINDINQMKNEIKIQEQEIDEYKKLESDVKAKLEELKNIETQLKNRLGLNSIPTSTQLSGITPLSNEKLNISLIDKQLQSFYSSIKSIDKKISAQRSYPSIFPTYGSISSYYGTRPSPTSSRGRREFHDGIDITGEYRTKIHAAGDGYVEYAGWLNVYGYAVIINHGNGYTTLYGHNSKLLVKKGARVTKNQVIALMGSTGRSTGTHVHFEIRYHGNTVNPLKIIKGGS